MHSLDFFKVIRSHIGYFNVDKIISFVSDESSLKAALQKINPGSIGNYLDDHFTLWMCLYAKHSTSHWKDYFVGNCELNDLGRDFAKFCFSEGIKLDKDKTLDSFSSHNQLSGDEVNKELLEAVPKDTWNILGYGLDKGDYEKSLADFLLRHRRAKQVKIYGFDPYAEQGDGIQYFSEDQIKSTKLRFDLVIARWVMHHVALKHRWSDLIHCINRCNTGARVLIVEHGFLRNQSVSLLERKLCYALNALFDIVANIGLRPGYFSDTAPEIGANFFIHYLTPRDFSDIKNKVSFQMTQSVYDIGPGFPNQTICCMKVK